MSEVDIYVASLPVLGLEDFATEVASLVLSVRTVLEVTGFETVNPWSCLGGASEISGLFSLVDYSLRFEDLLRDLNQGPGLRRGLNLGCVED